MNFLALGVVVKSKQAENEGAGAGCTVTGDVALVKQPVVLLVPVTATVAIPAASQLMVMALVPCPAVIDPLVAGTTDQVKVLAGSTGV